MQYKLQKQYRREGYDYSQDGFYFVTICCKNREMFFGNIKKEKMQLSKIGKIVKKFCLEIPDHFSFAKLDRFVIMPNHIHKIIEIDYIKKTPIAATNAPRRVPTGIQPLVKNSLSSVINHFKGNVKRFCNKNNLEYFAWQSRFHDRIIRNSDELNRIRQYIMDNPLKWETDRNNFENLYM